MGLLNLTLGQFLLVLAPLAAGLTALYLYDRARRRLTVSTLRFWPRRLAPAVAERRRKLQQPLSLLLQLLVLLFLLLAIADWRLGPQGLAARHHVLILDASSAMARRSAGGATWMAEARGRALAYLDALPAADRVMLIRADGTPSPAVPFTADRERLERAIAATESGWSALDWDAALGLARDSLRLALNVDDPADADAAGVGETVYVGPGKTVRPASASAPPKLRWIALGDELPDFSVRGLAARRMPDDPSRWEVGYRVWNDSDRSVSLKTTFHFEGRPLGERVLAVPARGEAHLEFRVRTESASRLEARIDADDALEADNRARLDLPALSRAVVRVFTDRPERVRPLVSASPLLEPRFRPAAEADQSEGLLRVVEAAGAAGGSPTIFLNPPPDGSPLPITATARAAPIVSWNSDHPLGEGLRETNFTPSRVQIFEPAAGDVVIAECERGPVVVARASGPTPFVVIGFDLAEAALANRPSTPLLFANAVRWFLPDVFRLAEARAVSPGTAVVETGATPAERIEVRTVEGPSPTWVVGGGRARFFSRAPGEFVVRTPYQESRVALTLLETPTETWRPPSDARRGVPPASAATLAGVPLWPWLALAALVLAALDWRGYGRRGVRPPAAVPERAGAPLEEVLR